MIADKFNTDAQEQYADSALVTATYLLITALYVHEDYFQLGFRQELDELHVSLGHSYMNTPDGLTPG